MSLYLVRLCGNVFRRLTTSAALSPFPVLHVSTLEFTAHTRHAGRRYCNKEPKALYGRHPSDFFNSELALSLQYRVLFGPMKYPCLASAAYDVHALILGCNTLGDSDTSTNHVSEYPLEEVPAAPPTTAELMGDYFTGLVSRLLLCHLARRAPSTLG